MKPYSKNTALQSICQAGGAPDQPSPYFFIVGAGLSYPSVPLADDMIQEWRASWLDRSSIPDDEPASDSKTMDRYEYWFQKVYLSRKPRQLYLRSKIKGKAIPSASFRLASILADSRISRLVVTTNFDLFLSRALGLLEQDPLVYDSADTTRERFALQTNDLQILHVHGTYQYYDCANLRGEIRDKVHQTVEVVDDVLRYLTPIVIGYSGWETDVIMTSLRRRLYADWRAPNPQQQRSLPYNVHWFCFRESTLETLPGWLKEHENVCLVVPELINRAAPPDRHGASLAPFREAVAISQPADATLSADEVLQGIIDKIGIQETELDKDPITFFVRRLKIYIRGMEDPQVESVATALKGLMKAQESLDEIHKDLHAARHQDALQKAIALYKSPLDLGMARRRELMDAVFSAACSIFTAEEDSPNLGAGFQLVMDLATELGARGANDESLQERMARTRLYQGLLTLRSDDYAASVALFNRVIDEYTAAAHQDVWSSAMVNKGIALCRWQKPANEEAGKEILALYDTVIKAHGGSAEPSLRESVASAFVNKGFLLNLIGHIQESLQAYDEAIERFGNAAEPSIQGHVTRAMINKGYRLGRNHTPADTRRAIDLYAEALRRLQGANRKSSQIQITLAWNGLAFQRLLLAKHTMPADPTQARQILLEARSAIQEAVKLAGDSGMVVGNQAYIEFLLGDDKSHARQCLEEAIRLGGEETRSGELEDLKVYRVPQDAEFEAWCRAAGGATGAATA